MPRLASAFAFLTSWFAGMAPAQQAPMPLRGELPTIGTVGDAPTADTLAIEVHQDGTLTVGGLPLGYDELLAMLRERAAALPGEPVGPWKPSRLNVLVRAAASLPLAAIAQVVRACVAPDVAAPRLFFGVRHVGDGAEGAFASFLPLDDAGTKGVEPNDHELAVRIGADIDGDPVGLCKQLAERAGAMDDAERQRTRVLLDAPGDLRWAVALGVLDAAARARLGGADLTGPMTRAQQAVWDAARTHHDLRALVAAVPTLERVGCRIGPVTVFAANVPDAPSRTAGAFAGFAALRLIGPPPPPEAAGIVVEELPITGGAAASDHAGEARTKAAIANGLRWLSLHQDEDGRWDSDQFMKHDRGAEASDGPGEAPHDVGVTGLALLALLGDGNTLRDGPYHDHVARGTRWLKEQQQQQKNGLIGVPNAHDFIYGHAIATIALVEACSGTGGRPLRTAAQDAINYLEAHRNPYAVWRYQPRDNDNDTAVTSWCIVAYGRAIECQLEVNRQALRFTEAWLDQITNPDTGHHGYSRLGEVSSRLAGDHAQRFPADKNQAMTGTGLFLRQLLGQPPASPICQKAAELVTASLPEWTPGNGNIDLYAWYWCTLGLADAGGDCWAKWQPAVTNALLAGQTRKGVAAGSWDPIGVWGEAGGRVYATAMATMTLETVERASRPNR